MKKIIPQDAILIPENARKVFKGVVFDVYQWSQKMFDGSIKTFEMLRRVDTVKAICVVDNKILLLQETQPTTTYNNEFPGGRVEENASSLLDEVKREVKEETGYEFTNWKLVHVRQVTYKIEGFFHYFLAWNPSVKHNTSLDEGENITSELVSFEYVKKLSSEPDHPLSDVWPVFRHAGNIESLLKTKEFA